MKKDSTINPRWKSGKRRKYQERFRALGLPCAICGRPIDYSLPYYVTDGQGRKHVNMWAFVIDERIPISMWQQAGYKSPSEAANDFTNLQPAHAICNARKGNKTSFKLSTNKMQTGQMQGTQPAKKTLKQDGKW